MRARLVAAAFAIALTAARLIPISDPDYHWHLHTGRFVVAARAIPATDPFSHTFRGAPWRFVDWIADVAMYALHVVGGDALVSLAFAAVGGVAVALAISRASRVSGSSLLPSVAGGLLLVAALYFRVTPRPQTLTFALLAALLLVLDRARVDRRAALLVPALIVVWQNLHSSALLGAAVAVAYAAGELVDRAPPPRRRRMLLAAALSIPALLVSVRPLDRLAAGFDHLGDPRVAALFAEWGHAFRPGAFGLHVVAVLVLAALAAAGVRRAREVFGAGSVLAAALLVVLGLASLRFLPLAAIALLPLATAGLERLSSRSWAASAVAIAAGTGLVAPQLRRPGLGLEAGAFPERAAAFLRERHVEGKLYNDFHFGGYLLWSLDGRAPVAIDGRSMAVYGVGFVSEVATATGDALARLIARTGATIAVVPPDRRMGDLQRLPGWTLVHFDDVAAVLVSSSELPAIARDDGYHAIAPGRWFDLAPLRADPVRREAARREAERALARAPDSSIAVVQAIAVALADVDLARAERMLDDATRRFPDVQRVARARLMVCLERGDRGCACATAKAIDARWPGTSYAKPTLAQLGCD